MFNPHCPHCIEMERAKRECVSCDILRNELARLQIENDRLLNRILTPPTQPVEEKMDTSNLHPINSNQYKPWRVRQQMLEDNDRKQAQLLRQKQQEMQLNPEKRDLTVSEIEKELGVEDAVR
jgi:hypothetical protein